MDQTQVVNVPRFAFWRTYLLIVSAIFAIQGITWMFFGSFDPFGFYTRLMAQAFWDTSSLTPEAQKTFAFAVVPLGATTTGYFILVHFLVKYAFPRRERWAYQAVVVALLVWFGLDTGFSLLHGAWFNVFVVNLPCLVMMGLPLLGLRRAFA